MVVAASLSTRNDRGAGGDGDVAPLAITRTTTSDIEEQAASLREWNQVYEQMTPGRFVGSLHEVCFAGLQLFHESTNQGVHESGTPWRGSRAIGVPTRMDGAALFRGRGVAADTMVTLGPEDELDFYTPRGFAIIGLVIDAVELEKHAQEVEHRDVATTFEGKHVLKLQDGRFDEFRRLLLSVLRSAEVNPGALQFRQAQRVLEQTLMSALVTAVDGDTQRATPPCTSRTSVVEAAKSFMRERIAEPITVADLCRELGVSRRTLQYSFNEVLGINPVRFLRAMRLNGARRDLKAGSRPRQSVQDIAARWGFWHLGHFVTDYKKMFGELPSQTLARESASPIARRR